MIRLKSLFIILNLLFIANCVSAMSSEWANWTADEYRFSIPVMKSMKIVPRNFGDGWTGIAGISEESVSIFGLVRLNESVSSEVIEQFAMDFTGTQADNMDLLKRQTDFAERGWVDLNTYLMIGQRNVVLAAIGHSSKGSYLFLLSASPDAFKRNKKNYLDWLKSIHLS